MLFPACAGVIPNNTMLRIITYTFPRVCGGDPSAIVFSNQGWDFSPRVRG